MEEQAAGNHALRSGAAGRVLKRLKKFWDMDQVQFAGYSDAVESVLSQHHGLILPSRFEGLPLAIVEAILCGRICITTDVSGNTQLLEDNVTGLWPKHRQRFISTRPWREHGRSERRGNRWGGARRKRCASKSHQNRSDHSLKNWRT